MCRSSLDVHVCACIYIYNVHVCSSAQYACMSVYPCTLCVIHVHVGVCICVLSLNLFVAVCKMTRSMSSIGNLSRRTMKSKRLAIVPCAHFITLIAVCM